MSPESSRKPVGKVSVSASEGRVVVAASLLLIVANLPQYLIGSLAFFLRSELDLGRAQLGLLVAGMLGAAMLGSFSSGRVVHRLGPSGALRGAAALTAVAALGAGVLTVDFRSLFGWLIAAGFGLALCEAAGTQLIADRMRPERLGSAMGIKQASPPVAAMLAGLCVPLVAVAAGWRMAFVGTAALALLAVLLPPASGTRGRRQDTRPPLPRKGPLVLFSVALALGLASTTSAATFLVDSVVVFGGTPTQGGLVLAGASVLAIVTRLLSGRVADGWSLSRIVAMVAALLGVGAFGYMLMATGEMRLAVIGALLAFGIGNGWNGLSFLTVARAGGRAAASAMGFVLVGGFFGALAGPLITGALVDRWSYQHAWLAVSSAMVISAFLMITAGTRLTRTD